MNKLKFYIYLRSPQKVNQDKIKPEQVAYR